MGSEQNERNGLRRRGDGASGFAAQYTIVDLDISALDLIRRYDGTKRAAWVAEVVLGAVQRQRTKRPPSEAFTRGLKRAKVIPPVVIVDLGRDGTKDGEEKDPSTGRKRKAGKNHSIIVDGRQRCMSERENDRKREADGEPCRLLDCDYMVPSSKTPRQDVVLFRVGSAIREIRSMSSRAEDAADMIGQRYAPEDVAPYVEVETAAEVELLVALHGCDESVKDAADAGKLLLADVAALAKCSHEEQAQRVARKLAGNRKRAKDAAAPPRAKTQPASVLLSWAAEVRASVTGIAAAVKESPAIVRREGFIEGLIAAAGGEIPAWAEAFRQSAALVRKAGGK